MSEVWYYIRMKVLQKAATFVFITASILFGITGVLVMAASPSDGEDPALWQMKILGILVFIILSSFAVSVALKYLTVKK